MDKSDTRSLETLLDRALAKAHGLPSPLRPAPKLNPGLMPEHPPDTKVWKAFVPDDGDHQDNTFWRYRGFVMSLILQHMGKSPRVIVQDDAPLLTIILRIRGLKVTPTGAFLLEVEYNCVTRHQLDADAQAQFQSLIDQGNACNEGAPLSMRTMDAMMIQHVLSANANRLHPEYKQHVRKAWGLDKGVMDVSFFVPAAPLTNEQLKSLQLRCAHSTCGLPAHLKCSRCQEERYCSQACQTAHWQRHRAQCHAKPPAR
ncbi:hypothetical protein WJX73_006455 [Symbiochloris irregularis]|uniref:MYND-type domain-containing protein n=1 Tax=Symbiochloris irregularis TaxID=706552 RepID=A0AAW1NRH2_9CHLO